MTGLEIGSCTVERGSGTPPTAQPSVGDAIVRSPSTVPGRSVAVMAADVDPFGGAKAWGLSPRADVRPLSGWRCLLWQRAYPGTGTSKRGLRGRDFFSRPGGP